MIVLLRRFLVTFSAGATAGVVSALLIAIADLYFAGHGYGELGREYFSWPEGGVHLSIGDIIMLGTVLLTVVVSWRRSLRP